ncbi:glycoside hydrolase family 2 TIM barrel-domain containing protein [Christiangramia echinicola]|uniref:glycoside hydrolase family 2 TIM barrel-domain containing protein n=1 Tax=Christiangramia echinicola TaxID=279359 RepID=UPI000423F302|nr:glycoside hydrolase family 2 TIM barrel-domain containing protein [Christiangramia echinicola]
MRQKINKNLYRAILILSFLAANAILIFGISSVWGYLNTGADRSTMLHTEIKSKQMYLPEISWDTTSYKGRTMEGQSLKEIERDYLNSWYVRNLALKNNEGYGIEDYYTDSARVNIYRILDDNKVRKINFNSTTTAHHPELQFYSADGQLVVFNDINVIEYSESLENGKILDRSVDTSSYRVMMLLEDGFWRVRHMQQVEDTLNFEPIESFSEWGVNEDQVFYQDHKYDIKGINYYPQKTPWDMFGDEFDMAAIKSDFNLINQSGLNTIRIFIPYEDFGAADVQENKIYKLKNVLDAAENYNLKILVTLFDFYGDYSVLNWTLTHEHLRQIVSRFRDHPAILGWDIKNEPDLDFDNRGKELVLNWLKNTIAQVKKADPSHFVTVGWSNPESAALLQEEVDLVSFHYYKDIDDLEMTYAGLKKRISKPMILGEFGMSSYNGLWNPFGYDESDQAEYHKKIQTYLKKKDLAFISWTLYDFEEVPSSVVGSLPWRKARQKYFGFIDSKGNKKKSFDHIVK